jgi:hypothetical protein
VEAFTDTVRLRALGLGARVIDVFDREMCLRVGWCPIRRQIADFRKDNGGCEVSFV